MTKRDATEHAKSINLLYFPGHLALPEYRGKRLGWTVTRGQDAPDHQAIRSYSRRTSEPVTCV